MQKILGRFVRGSFRKLASAILTGKELKVLTMSSSPRSGPQHPKAYTNCVSLQEGCSHLPLLASNIITDVSAPSLSGRTKNLFETVSKSYEWLTCNAAIFLKWRFFLGGYSFLLFPLLKKTKNKIKQTWKHFLSQQIRNVIFRKVIFKKYPVMYS